MRERSEERNGNIMEQKTSILIADPNEEFRRSCRERLCAFGYSVIAEARDGEDALSKIGTIHPDIAIVDAWLPGLDGAKLIRRYPARIPRYIRGNDTYDALRPDKGRRGLHNDETRRRGQSDRKGRIPRLSASRPLARCA